jgi:tetratricopeptide (TPR) repeat protein
MNIGSQFVQDLQRALTLRHVSEGAAMLDAVREDLKKLESGGQYAAELLLLVAQWVDVGYHDDGLLDTLLLKFPIDCKRRLPLKDYLRVRMAEAFRSLSQEEVDPAIQIIDFVLKAEAELTDTHLVTLAHFWKGRAHRKKGEYESALQDIVQARQLAQKCDDCRILAAVIQIQESWLLFQKGSTKEALRLLAHSEGVLKSTDHYLALGNIESARGRIVRRSGEYAKALEHFERAIAIYSQGDPNHRNIARTLVNAAHVKRLVALQLRRKIDAQAKKQSQTKGSMPSKGVPTIQGNLRGRYQQLCDEAILQLKRAKQIYSMHGHSSGLGAVLFNEGYLYLDRGEIDRAAAVGGEAYLIGVEKNDHILMARARILQASAENARVEEQLGEDADTALHAAQARSYCEEALALAQQTQNHRLLANAHIACGMTAANEFFQEWETAKRYASEAAELIGAGENDHLLDELATLKSHIIQSSGIHDTLRGWSEGMLGDKTFQQVNEEFAEIVIPKVWMREEKKISRVAESLSISPKKVRRILRNAGYLDAR